MRPLDILKGTLRPYGGPGVTPFVILFLPRTGSNYLASMLDTHDDILCHHEIFLPGSIHRSLSVREGTLEMDLGRPEERDSDPIAFLRRVLAMNAGFRAVGFKLSLADPRRSLIASLVLNRSVRKIVVRRDNWLQVYTSALIAEQTNKFLEFADERDTHPGDTVRVNVDTNQFVRYARKRRIAYRALGAMLRATGQPFIEVEYRDIQEPEKVRQVLRFLGVDGTVALRARTTKQNPNRLADRIENWGDVSTRLRGTRYASLLEQD